MILTVDIGNSNVTLGGFVVDTPFFTSRISTNIHASNDNYVCRILILS